jgi:hypothetical protein
METGPFLKTQIHLNEYPLGAEVTCYVQRDCMEIAEDFCEGLGVQSFIWDTIYNDHWEWDYQFKQWYRTKLQKINLRFTCNYQGKILL